MPRYFMLAAPLVLLAGASAAQESGTLALDIGGASRSYTLWSEQSDWSGWGEPPAVSGSVNIYARPEEGGGTFATFTLGLDLMSGAVNGAEASLLSLSDGETTRYFSTDDQGALAVELSELSVDGEFLSISGSLSGQMGPSPDFGRTVDLSEPLAISGEFAVTLGPVE
ncbi:hypothetical protein [Litorisediminicola beolgyonensis]|uniref:Lipid/polyisoprenoid-binding YceI-like domain-containing protein n=1 Tax=Litorisediminicola beolgyonensis TaxID=1173614 RepID=A0ABW3ZGP1_9RHOB